MRASEQPGCAIAIAYRGGVVLEAAFGYADLGAGEVLTPRHRFRVASHSKSFTAAAILKLREQGRLKLDDTAGAYVQGLHPQVAAATIGQLLSHTAGLFRDGLEAGYWEDRAPFSDEAKIRDDLKLAPAIDANSRLKYSNHGFALAGLIIEAITGEPFGVWVWREIVEAAGLKETAPDVPLPPKARLARGHSGKTLLGRRLVFAGDAPTSALAAATGFISTAADLARFFGQLAPNAAKSVLSLASRREMTRPQWRDPFTQLERSYGLGTISGALDGWEWFGHSGGFQGYLTRTAVVPKHGLAVSVLTNSADGMAQDWLDGALHILQRFAAEGPPMAALADWDGRWWSVWGAVDLVAMGHKVLLASPGLLKPFLKAPELRVTGPDEARIEEAGAFHSHGEAVRRLRGTDGAVSALRIAAGRFVPETTLAAELLERYGARSSPPRGKAG
ncbi:MAG TPA: serine hydrolase domain-containing protein [Caulobacteraceae bacterium]